MDRSRSGRRERQKTQRIAQLPWRQTRNSHRVTDILSSDQVEKIHLNSLEVLESIGVEFLLPEACDLLAAAGASVDRETARVRLDRGMVMECVSKAPSAFHIHARNPSHDIHIGGRSLVFATVASAPNASDSARGRRPGNFVDYENFLRLAQVLNITHTTGGYPVEPTDVPAETRHLDCVRSMLVLTDKTYRIYALGRERIEDGLAMTRIAHRLSKDAFRERSFVYTNVNINSPLRIDGPMLSGLIELARQNQPVIITPFTLSGAMAPVTLAGALVQQNAEALAAITLAQIARAGAPVIYGGFTSNVDMKSGSPAFGTPENVKATIAGGQLARRYGLPYRSSNSNASNAVDAQATYESLLSLWAAIAGGANFIQHALGWLEGGLVASFEKMVLDAELLQNMVEILEPIVVDDESMALSAIREVGPGGHFFGSAHTLQRYRSAFYEPILSDWSNYERWRELGAQKAETRATAIVDQLLAEYETPPIEADIVEALDEYVRKRKEGSLAAGD